MNLINNVLIIISIMILSACGSSTTVMIKTKPSRAEVVVLNYKGEQKGKVTSDTIFKIKNNEDFFMDSHDSTNAMLLATKKGYKPEIATLARIRKNEDNDDKRIIKLKELNTSISIETTPPGANIIFLDAANHIIPFLAKEAISLKKSYSIDKSFVKDYLRDIGHTTKAKIVNKIITPFEEKYTEATAQSSFSKISKIYIVKQGYNPVAQDLSIRPSESNVYSFHLKPFSTSLKIISEPEGVEIEDLGGRVEFQGKDTGNARRMNGFGYLGKAPLIRKFSFDEVDKRYTLSNNRNSTMTMMLKITKAGFETEHLQIDIPFGEQKTIKVTMQARPKEVSFQSDPQGSHVYVFRQKTREVYDSEKTKKIHSIKLDHWKHLGVTPFTYYTDVSDPLHHTDKLKFSRPGFQDTFDQFKSGVSNYHTVLEPKGAISYQGTITK